MTWITDMHYWPFVRGIHPHTQTLLLDSYTVIALQQWEMRHVLRLADVISSVIAYIDGSVLDCSISIANALEILQSCTEPSIYKSEYLQVHYTLGKLQGIVCSWDRCEFPPFFTVHWQSLIQLQITCHLGCRAWILWKEPTPVNTRTYFMEPCSWSPGRWFIGYRHYCPWPISEEFPRPTSHHGHCQIGCQDWCLDPKLTAFSLIYIYTNIYIYTWLIDWFYKGSIKI